MNDEAMKKNVDDTLSACIDYSTGLIGLKTMRTILETLYLKGRCNGMRYALDKKGKNEQKIKYLRTTDGRRP